MSAIGPLERDLQRRTRRLGGHYTPGAIVRRAVAAALGPLCRRRDAEAILRLRILDPAAGSGRFLVAALDHLAKATGQPERLRGSIATTCLFGIDIHAEAVALARRSLAEATGLSPEAFEQHLLVADSLLADIRGALGTDCFDAVLTNPPWLSYSGRQAAALAPARRRRLAARFAAFRRWPTTHGAFLELAARLLAPGGRAALVVPHQVCHLRGYEATRRTLAERCRFEPPPEPLGEDAFPGVVQPAAIVYLHCPASLHQRAGHGGRGCNAPVGLGVPYVSASGQDMAMEILRCAERHPPAPPGTFRDPGVHSGNSARLILREDPCPGLAPIREGRCVHPFALAPAHKWLIAEPDLPAGRYCTIRAPEAYVAARIVLRQTAPRPIAARHVEPTYFRNSILACLGVEGLDDATLLGLLNSDLLAFVHRHLHADSRQRAFPQVKVSHLQALPIARDAGDLARTARRLEALAADRLAAETRLLAAVADLLDCPVALLARKRLLPSLLRGAVADAARGLARRLRRARRPLERPGARRALARALGSAHRVVSPLEAAWRRERATLSRQIYRVYDVTQAQARFVEAQVRGG